MSRSTGKQEKENRRLETFIAALLEVPTLPQAAERTGISLSTAKRWLQQPDCIRQYREARQGLLTSTVGRLAKLTAESLTTLNRIMLHSLNDSARVGAARAVLTLAFEASLQVDMDERLTALEHSSPGLKRGPVRVAS